MRSLEPNRDYLAAITSQGAHYAVLGDLDKAQTLLEETLAVSKKLNDSYHQVAAATSLLFILNAQGEGAKAAQIAEYALSLGQFEFSDALRTNLAAVYLSLKKPDKAEEHLSHVTRHCPDPTFKAISHARLASIYHDLKQPKKVPETLSQALLLLAETDIASAHLTVIVAVLKFGKPTQVQTIMKHLKTLDKSRFNADERTKLQAALEDYQKAS